MAGILSGPALTGPSQTDEARFDSPVRLPLRQTVVELLVGSAVAVVVSMILQFASTRLGISEPSYAPEALASLGGAVVLGATFLLVAFRRHHFPQWTRIGGAWLSLTAFTTLTLALPLEGTRFYFGGSATDNGFRMQYMTRMASTPGLADMNYADTAPYYPGGWFWLGGRFANLLGWEGWAAYKPYALVWVAVTTVVAFTLWSLVVRRRFALVAALATALAGMMHGIEEPYAWPSAAWLAPIAVLTWQALRRPGRAPRWTLFCIGAFVGFAAITYTLHFGFAVMLIVTMAVVVGVFRVRGGAGLWPTVRALFLRLLPIGVVSAVVSLLVWLPYLLSTGFLLHNPKSAAQHYLPDNGAYLPTPMAEASPFGALCLAGVIWLVLRCRRSDIAAALLTIVIAVYCWFGLSTLALVAKTTLLAFRLNVILDGVLAVAGVFGLLELLSLAHRWLDARYATRISAVGVVLGLAGAVTLSQGAIGSSLEKSAELAYTDYYPTGDNAKGQRDPSEDGSWTDDLIRTIERDSGRAPQQNIVLSTDYKLMSFKPYWGFQQETPHYANPLAQYDDRAAEVERWTKARTSGELLDMLRRSPFEAPNVFVLRNPEKEQGTTGKQTTRAPATQSPQGTQQGSPQANGPDAAGPDSDKLSVTLKADSFPQQPNVRDYDVHFDPAVFNSPEFVHREVGPYTVIVRH